MAPGTFASKIALFCILVSGCAQTRDWKEVRTTDRQVWRADCGRWRAEVEPSRGRLTFLGKIGGKNLLLRPEGPPSDLEFGGHRVWLGPQTEWKALWPPPPEWESRRADTVKLKAGGQLEVASPENSVKVPSIRRIYRWSRPGLLECRVVWAEEERDGRQSVNVLQLADGAIVEAKASPNPSAPNGFVQIPLSGPLAPVARFAVPAQAKVTGNRVLMRRASSEAKLGFPVQTLTARWPDAVLVLRPGRTEGRVTGDPDSGFRSHVYLGPDEWPVMEIEQLSPKLSAWKKGRDVSFTVSIELDEPRR